MINFFEFAEGISLCVCLLGLVPALPMDILMDICRHSSPKDLEGTVMKRTYNNITFLDPSLYLDYYAGPLEIFMATRIDV